MCEADWRGLTPALRYRHKNEEVKRKKKKEAEPFFLRPEAIWWRVEGGTAVVAAAAELKVETRREKHFPLFPFPLALQVLNLGSQYQLGLEVFSGKCPLPWKESCGGRSWSRWLSFGLAHLFFLQRNRKKRIGFLFSILIVDQNWAKPTIFSSNSNCNSLSFLIKHKALLYRCKRKGKRYVNETGLSLLDKIAETAALRWPIETNDDAISLHILRQCKYSLSLVCKLKYPP